GDLRETLGPSFRPTNLDRDGAALNPAEFAQPLHQSGDPLACDGRRGPAQKPNSRQLARLLPARRERPRSGAAEQRDELAPLHSITSSARERSVGGISMPSTFAVLRLMTSLNFVGCWTGKSPGFSPLRMRPT